MILVIALLVASTAIFIALCTRSPRSSMKQAQPCANQSPQLVSAPKEPPLASVTPQDSPPNSWHTQSHPHESSTPEQQSGVGPSKGHSPGGSGKYSGTGGTPGSGTDTNGKTTPQSSAKREGKSTDVNSKGVNTKEMEPSQESQDLLIQTLSIGPDSLMERGHTTKTKVDASKYQPPSRKKKRGKGKRSGGSLERGSLERGSLEKEKTVKHMLSPKSPKKSAEKVKEKGKKKEAPTSPKDHRENEQEPDVLVEGTGQDPTEERLKRNPKTEKDEMTMEGRLITPNSIVDTTQCSQTGKERAK